MKKSLLALSLLLIIYTLLLPGCNRRVYDHEQVGEDERIVIKFSHVVAENTPKGQAALRFANLVHERTSGLVEVQVYPNSTLYMDGEEIRALQVDNAQIIAPAIAKTTDYFPELTLFDLPFQFNDYEDVYRFWDEQKEKGAFKENKEHNMKILDMWDNGFKIMSANRPLIMPTDFLNLNFRIMHNPLLEEQFQLLGSQTTMLPFNEVYSALADGTVDGAENPPSNFYTKRFFEVQSNVTISNHGYLGYVVLTNTKFWSELPDDIRLIMEDSLKEVTQWQREQAREINKNDLEKIIRTEEVNIHILSEEEKQAWKDALSPLRNYYNPIN